MRMDSPQTVHLSSLVQALYSPSSIRYLSSSGPRPSPPLATPACHPCLVGQFRCLALAFTQPPSALSSTLKRVTDRASVSSPHAPCVAQPVAHTMWSQRRLPLHSVVLHMHCGSHLCHVSSLHHGSPVLSQRHVAPPTARTVWSRHRLHLCCGSLLHCVVLLLCCGLPPTSCVTPPTV